MIKLYQYDLSPNSRRVRIFLAEKGLYVPTVSVDISKGESHTPDFLKLNPMGEVPLLATDDGCYIAESVAICRYFEVIQPEPYLFGATPTDIATIEMWQRRIELKWFGPLTQYWAHTSPIFASKFKQIPEWAEQNCQAIMTFLAWLDSELSGREYIAGDRYSIADILALAAIDHSNYVVGLKTSPAFINLARWHQMVSSRPSAKA
jgi:glutathione S-transferase